MADATRMLADSDEREQFESWLWGLEWARDHHFHRRDMPGSARSGEYVVEAIELSWQAWQARGALGVALPAPRDAQEAAYQRGKRAGYIDGYRAARADEAQQPDAALFADGVPALQPPCISVFNGCVWLRRETPEAERNFAFDCSGLMTREALTDYAQRIGEATGVPLDTDGVTVPGAQTFSRPDADGGQEPSHG